MLSLHYALPYSFDRRKTFWTATGAVGYKHLGKTHPVEGDISFGTLFGPDKQFGIVLATNYSKRTIESQNAQSGSQWDVVDGLLVTLENTLREYQKLGRASCRTRICQHV